MNKQDLRIVFMGTPDFAVATLKDLVDNGFHVVGVVTSPDRPAGRGKQISCSSVKTAALALGIPVLQPEKLKDEQFLKQLRDLKADLQIVVAFRMLPEVVWSMPPQGTFNLHASLLPQYRGAAPINHALMNGENKTGVTTFMLDHEIDTGKILFQEHVEIFRDEDAGTLHDKLMIAGSKLVLQTVEAILSGDLTAIPQAQLTNENIDLKKAPKIFKPDCYIKWNSSGERVYNFVRGLSPYPAALSTLIKSNGERILMKIFKTNFQEYNVSSMPGTIHCPDKKTLLVTVNNGYIQIEELQQAGKRRMNVEEFLRGAGDFTGSYFTV
jgi:methionyl-tRNA formyltransferase